MAEGLRERSRVRRRAAIERAALRLFAQNGYESTTLAQIADEAEVSTRTLTLYFPTKLDLALAYGADAAGRLDEACGRRAPGASVLEVLHAWIEREVAEHGESMSMHAAMLAANPILRGSETAAVTAARLAVTREFAADLGRPADDPVVTLTAGALVGLISALLDLAATDAGLEGSLHAATAIVNAVVDSARAVTS